MRNNIKYIASVIILVICMAGCAEKTEETKIIGSYDKTIDCTNYAREQAEKFIEDTWMADEINIENYISDITVSINVTLYSNGTYSESLIEDTYDEAYEIAKKGLEDALTDLIIIRMKAATKPINNRADVDRIMVEKTGLDIKGYIENYGPKLMEDKEILIKQYSISGSYALPEGNK